MAKQIDLCPHFGECGGCDRQEMPYEEELKLKEKELSTIFSGLGASRMEPIIPSPEIWFYRNRMEYAAGFDSASATLGLRRKKRFYRVVDLKECRIFLKDTGRILDAAREWMKAFGIEPYHMSRHTGVMRYLVLRHSKYYDGLMAGAVVALTPEEFEKRREDLLKLFEALRAVRPLASAYACLNKGVADVTLTEEILPLHGEGCIKERIGDIDYSLYPASFFQTNSSCCGRLYEAVKESLRRIGGNALDIYCGSGGITLQLAGIFDRVTGIDNSTRNIEYAVKNAASNRIKNAQFLSADAEKFLADSRKDGSLEDFAAMVVDPPRAGLGRKTRSIILENGAPRLVYVSCNPMTLADDLKELVKSYKIRKVMPVDMFPHTRHLEAVAVLERITR